MTMDGAFRLIATVVTDTARGALGAQRPRAAPRRADRLDDSVALLGWVVTEQRPDGELDRVEELRADDLTTLGTHDRHVAGAAPAHDGERRVAWIVAPRAITRAMASSSSNARTDTRSSPSKPPVSNRPTRSAASRRTAAGGSSAAMCSTGG